ncbi:Putative electron transport protein YccM [Planctomycetes bacterium K23_9]|uniref:Electron transport protein YccM n=2 Tax=Stieleria marina TaxID=1930275 RepID=A0A517P2S9_9BACT|nr:Putative electron transport protein YccM [Planctomycetes bacterium K23_9]
MLGVASGLLIAILGHAAIVAFVPESIRPIAIAFAAVVIFASLLILVSQGDRRSATLLRVDWFLPQLRRLKANQVRNDRWMGRVLSSCVPSSWRSDHRTKKRGAIRRGLRKIGLTWLASPPRRISQAVCFVAFLALFFYVCWPYSTRPLPPSQVSSGWQFVSIDQATGDIELTGSAIPDWLSTERPENESQLFLSAVELESTGCRLVSLSGDLIRLRPDAQVGDQTLDALLTGTKAWDIADRDPAAWPSHYADNLSGKERVPAELFLVIDPLVSLSTAIASRSWVWSLVCAAVIGIVCVVIPRGFCGYLCPLGTLIDLFDWAVTSRTKRFQVPGDGWWVHTKYYLLAGTLVAATFGVLVSGFVAAIPVLTRGMLFVADPLQSGTLRGWHLVPSMNAGHFLSIALFLGVLCLGFLRPRFWCKYVCPSGAVFSVANLFRVTERKVESSCINCNKCVEICPFDAIKPDFTTRETDCTMCQSCGGVCPTHAIKFVERWNVVELKVENDPPTNETALGRRGFLSLAAGGTAATVGGLTVAGGTKLFGANLDDPNAVRPVRPPGSVPEQEFLEMCIRCGECFKACPNNVLQAEGFLQGLEGLWTPQVVADWAGCESSCNACGQVCPTGAIRALPLEEKRVARMGLAIVNESTCLPYAGREDCDLCVQECNAAGYEAIEYIQVGTESDENGRPIEGTGMLAPVVLADKCVGCGLCQTRCYGINVKEKGLLSHSAIIIEAGEGKEDRLMAGSYIELRRAEQETSSRPNPIVDSPIISKPDEASSSNDDENPFGL